MFQYRKILEMHREGFSLRSTAPATGHSRQKVSEVVKKAKVRDFAYPLTDEMTDHWLDSFLRKYLITISPDIANEHINEITKNSPSKKI